MNKIYNNFTGWESILSEMQEEILSLMGSRKGHFAFESGHHGDRWLDLELLCVRPEKVRPFCIELAKRLVKYEVQSVCGALTEGAFLALQVASELNIDFCYAVRTDTGRRDVLYPIEYRLPGVLRNRVRGKRVAIVNDVINAGSAVLGTISDLADCGAQPIVVAALLVRSGEFKERAANRKVALESLAFTPSNLWQPSDCPLCASGMKLDGVASF